MFLCLYLRPPRSGGRGPGEGGGLRGRFTGVEGVQRRGRSSGVWERVGGMGCGWRWRRGSVQETVQGAKSLG